MKPTTFLSAILSATFFGCGISTTFALTDAQIRHLGREISEVSVLELAPKSAELVRSTAPADRVEVAVELVRIVARKKPVLVPAVLAAILKVAPETSVACADAASELCPEQSAEIAHAASAASPENAELIAAATARHAPKSARQIARTVVALSPSTSDRILESILAVAPQAKKEIENDIALNVIGVLARNTRASASRNVAGKIGSKPLPNPPSTTPTPATSITAQPRSAAVQSAIQQLQNLEGGTSITSKSVQSEITIATINALNVIGRESSITKTEKDAIINSTMVTVSFVISSSTALETDRSDVIKTTALVVASIVSDSGLSASVKSDYVSFAAQSLKTIFSATVAQPSTTLQIAIKNTASELNQVVESVRNKSADDAEAGLTKAQEKVSEIKKTYGSP